MKIDHFQRGSNEIQIITPFKNLCFHNLNYFCWIFARENRRSIKDFRASYFCFFCRNRDLRLNLATNLGERLFFSFLRFF